MSAQIFTLYDAQALAAITEAAEHHAVVQRGPGPDSRTGQAERIWRPISAELADLTGRTDVRDLSLVVKLAGGSERVYWQIGELIREYHAGTFVIGLRGPYLPDVRNERTR